MTMEEFLRQYYYMIGKTPLTDTPGWMSGFSNELDRKQHQIEKSPQVNNPENRSYFDGYPYEIRDLEDMLTKANPQQRKALLESFYTQQRQNMDRSLNLDQFHHGARQSQRNLKEMDYLQLPGKTMDRLEKFPWGRFM